MESKTMKYRDMSSVLRYTEAIRLSPFPSLRKSWIAGCNKKIGWNNNYNNNSRFLKTHKTVVSMLFTIR